MFLTCHIIMILIVYVSENENCDSKNRSQKSYCNCNIHKNTHSVIFFYHFMSPYFLLLYVKFDIRLPLMCFTAFYVKYLLLWLALNVQCFCHFKQVSPEKTLLIYVGLSSIIINTD